MPLSLPPTPSRLHIAALAGAFADVLSDWLGSEGFERMRRDNRAHVGTTTCASHDQCDANMAMLEAFETTFGATPRIEDAPDGSEGPDVALWNAAWAFASAVWLTAPGKAVPAFHEALLVKFSDRDGENVYTLAELMADLEGTSSPNELARLEYALLHHGSYEGGGGAEPIWSITLQPPKPQ